MPMHPTMRPTQCHCKPPPGSFFAVLPLTPCFSKVIGASRATQPFQRFHSPVLTMESAPAYRDWLLAIWLFGYWRPRAFTMNTCNKPFPFCDEVSEDRSSEQTSN